MPAWWVKQKLLKFWFRILKIWKWTWLPEVFLQRHLFILPAQPIISILLKWWYKTLTFTTLTSLLKTIIWWPDFKGLARMAPKKFFKIFIRNSKSFEFDLTALESNVQNGFQLAKKYGCSDIINIIKTQQPDIASGFPYPLSAIVNDPATHIHFCIGLSNLQRW